MHPTIIVGRERAHLKRVSRGTFPYFLAMADGFEGEDGDEWLE